MGRVSAARSGPGPGVATPISLVVTVKAYPNISRKHGEVVCVAGIRTDTPSPRWVRLWPIEFRDLPFSQRFAKYQRITLRVRPSPKDPRPESVRPVTDSLQLGRRLGTSGEWLRRRALVEPLVRGSMCDVLQQQRNDRTSLAAIRPGTVEDLIIDKEASDWAPNQLAVIGQGGLFDAPKSPLKKIPYRFRYRYRCANRSCPGHTQSIIDWELGQAYLSWKGTEEERLRKIREKWLGELCGPSKDTIFFVGNMHLHPRNFLVLGVFWPPKQVAVQPSLGI